MRGKVFLDSNVLVYLFSLTEPDKRERCQSLIKSLSEKAVFVWSTQVVQELYQVLTKKYGKNPQLVKTLLGQFKDLELFINDLDVIKNAIDIQTINRLSFWDSLIISSAELSLCSYLLTEDLNHGQIINGVTIQSPFKL